MTRSRRCRDGCSCECHKYRRFNTPPVLSRILGTLFIGYSGLPILGGNCGNRVCKTSSNRYLELTYFFPLWFLAKAVSLVAGTPYMGRLTLGIIVRGRLNDDFDLNFFRKVENGDNKGVISLLESRKVCPNDTHLFAGTTALHVCELIR